MPDRLRLPPQALAPLLALALSLLPATPTLANPVAPAPLVWQLSDPATIGGLRADVLGSPQIRRDADGNSIAFDGARDGLYLLTNPLAGQAAFTIEVLLKPDGTGEPEQRFLHIQDSRQRRVLLETRLSPDGRWTLDTFLHSDPAHRRTLIDPARLHPSGRWHWVALTYDGKTMAHYVNAVKECEGTVAFPPMAETGTLSLGVRQNKINWFKGAIREVRFTPAALPPESLQRVPSASDP